MSDNLPPLPDLNRLAPFVEGLGKAILREMIEDLSAIEADRVSRDVPEIPDELCDDDLSELAHSANQEALSFGLSHDVFLRYFITIRNRALAASQPQPVQAQPLTCVECGGVLGHTRMCSKFSGYTNKAANQQKD